MTTVYYAALDDTGDPLALFRAVIDDANEKLDLEFLGGDGVWVNDPTLIDEIHQADVQIVPLIEVDALKDALVAA